MDAELVTVEAEHVQITPVVLEIGANLLVEHRVNYFQPLLIFRTQTGNFRACRGNGSGGLRIRRRCRANGVRHFTRQVLPVSTTILRDGDPAINIKYVSDVINVEKRLRERIAFRL